MPELLWEGEHARYGDMDAFFATMDEVPPGGGDG
jgi:hypothetical protein